MRKTEPAFPIIVDGHGDPGLTKKEYFAAMALQGLCANPQNSEVSYRMLAEEAVKHANALSDILDCDEL
jgi:hypothetical protein